MENDDLPPFRLIFGAPWALDAPCTFWTLCDWAGVPPGAEFHAATPRMVEGGLLAVDAICRGLVFFSETPDLAYVDIFKRARSGRTFQIMGRLMRPVDLELAWKQGLAAVDVEVVV